MKIEIWSEGENILYSILLEKENPKNPDTLSKAVETIKRIGSELVANYNRIKIDTAKTGGMSGKIIFTAEGRNKISEKPGYQSR